MMGLLPFGRGEGVCADGNALRYLAVRQFGRLPRAGSNPIRNAAWAYCWL
jgi:hypothetical protein